MPWPKRRCTGRCRPLADRRPAYSGAGRGHGRSHLPFAVANSQRCRLHARPVALLDLANADRRRAGWSDQRRRGPRRRRYVFRACDLALAADVDAIVTAPLNKATIHLGGHIHPGRTELLAEEANKARRWSACCWSARGAVVHVSTRQARGRGHPPPWPPTDRADHRADVSRAGRGVNRPGSRSPALTRERGRAVWRRCSRLCPLSRGGSRPRLEYLSDPQPPTPSFCGRSKGAFDIVAMYHDQGISMKLLAFDSGVNVGVGYDHPDLVDHQDRLYRGDPGRRGRRTCWPRSM